MEDSFVYIFKKLSDFWYVECDRVCGKIPISFGEDFMHQHLMITGEPSFSQLQKMDPLHENSLKAHKSVNSIISPRIFFRNK